jgi:chemotaxis protein MotB
MGAAEKLKETHEEDHHHEMIALAGHDDHPHAEEDGEGIWLMSYADMMTLLMGFFALLTSMATFEENKFAEVGDKAAEFFGGTVEKPYEDLGKELIEIIEQRNLGDQVQITVLKTEINITFEGTLFFSSGSIELREPATLLMTEIIQILGEKAPTKRFYIEGHTDDIPISHGIIASNWELSSLRAAAVARLFEYNGFARDHLMTLGWGETRPLKPNRDEFGRPIFENQSQNRRVVLKIMDRLPL